MQKHCVLSLKVTDAKARKGPVQQKRLCLVCLQKGHSAASCKKHYLCKKCGGKHNISICTFINNTPLLPPPNPVDSTNQSDGTRATADNFSSNKNSVHLQSAVLIINKK